MGVKEPARLLAALAVCAAALAACGSASKPSSSGSADTQALRYANCMRANGMPNFPDPGSNGALSNPALPAFRAAAKACAKLQPVGMHLHGPPAPSAAELRAALAFARCMRAHGFSHFPDPLTTYGPGLTLGRGSTFRSTARPTSSRLRRRSGRQPRPAECSFPRARRSHAGQATGGTRPDIEKEQSPPRKRDSCNGPKQRSRSR